VKKLPLLLLALSALASAQFDSDRVRLLANVPLTDFLNDPASASGCSGFVSASGREYAVIGVRNGNAVVDITNPSAPKVIGTVEVPASLWHEVAVLGHYAY